MKVSFSNFSVSQQKFSVNNQSKVSFGEASRVLREVTRDTAPVLRVIPPVDNYPRVMKYFIPMDSDHTKLNPHDRDLIAQMWEEVYNAWGYHP